LLPYRPSTNSPPTACTVRTARTVRPRPTRLNGCSSGGSRSSRAIPARSPWFFWLVPRWRFDLPATGFSACSPLAAPPNRYKRHAYAFKRLCAVRNVPKNHTSSLNVVFLQQRSTMNYLVARTLAANASKAALLNIGELKRGESEIQDRDFRSKKRRTT
jgi:hypothetical protein